MSRPSLLSPPPFGRPLGRARAVFGSDRSSGQPHRDLIETHQGHSRRDLGASPTTARTRIDYCHSPEEHTDHGPALQRAFDLARQFSVSVSVSLMTAAGYASLEWQVTRRPDKADCLWSEELLVQPVHPEREGERPGFVASYSAGRTCTDRAWREITLSRTTTRPPTQGKQAVPCTLPA